MNLKRQKYPLQAMDIQVSADVASGQYDSAQQVTLTAGEGAEIYYTLDAVSHLRKIKKFLSPLKNMKDRLQSRKIQF